MITRISLALVIACAVSWLHGGDSKAQPAENSSLFCVFTSRPDGTALTFLSPGVGGAWSPTGARLAIGLVDASETEAVVSGTRLVRRGGELIRELAQNQWAWLDEKRLLVSGARGHPYGIAQLDGTVRNLRLPPRTRPLSVTLATAAKLITVVLYSESDEEYNRRILFFNVEGRVVATWRQFLSGKWELSPDARRIALTTEYNVAGASTGVAMRDGSQGSHLAGVAARSFAWSPDGKRLAVVLSSTGNDIERAAPAAAGLYIHDVARKRSFRRIVRGAVGKVSWSPNGTRLAYWTGAGIFTVPAVGGAPKRIGQSADTVAWSPNGARIAYGTEGAIFTAAAGGGTPTRITPADGYGYPSWSPDGTRIAFTRRLNDHVSAPPCPRG